jgi:hypothetical protein
LSQALVYEAGAAELAELLLQVGAQALHSSS